jgi:hypothetical protein
MNRFRRRGPAFGSYQVKTVQAERRAAFRMPSDVILTFIRRPSAQPLSPRPISPLRQPLFAHGHESGQPGVLIRRWMDRDDPGAIDIDLAEDLPKRVLA